REPNQSYTYVSRYYEGPVHDFAQPVRNGTLGEIRLGLSEMRIDGVVAATTLRMLLITGFVAGLGVLAATFLTWLLTRPILDLVHTTEQVRQGNFAARAPRWTDDEIGELADAFNRMVRELARSRQTIQEKEAARSKLLSSLINAQEEERKRIARELHDGIGQALTSLLVNLKLIEQADTLPRAQQIASAMRAVTSETLEDARTLSRDLRPSALDDLGLVPALERYVAELASRYPKLELDLHATLSERLPSPVETSLYRIVQEALTNAARHGGATTIAVVLGERERSLQAIVEDNGHGFDVTAARRSGTSVGLHNMAERAELLGGKLSIESNRNGTTVYIEIPVRDEHE
ncbi:MAG: sensor histidine kinase, partial [Caldilineaceae bacterium]|nr:sensor histidine kinase [Caldilineaceae bacterium]